MFPCKWKWQIRRFQLLGEEVDLKKKKKGGTLRGWRAGDSINSPRSSDRSRVTLSSAGDQRETGDRRATRAPPLVAPKKGRPGRLNIFSLVKSVDDSPGQRTTPSCPPHNEPKAFSHLRCAFQVCHLDDHFSWKTEKWLENFIFFVSDLYVLVLKPFMFSR